jgi:hypothetical protein
MIANPSGQANWHHERNPMNATPDDCLTSCEQCSRPLTVPTHAIGLALWPSDTPSVRIPLCRPCTEALIGTIGRWLHALWDEDDEPTRESLHLASDIQEEVPRV